MLKGVNILADAVKVTWAPKAATWFSTNPFGAPRITKDGVTVAKEIELEDKFENMGAQMVKEVASRTNDEAGDGTTTATVLAQAIVKEGMKSVAAGMNPMDLKRGIDRLLPRLLQASRHAPAKSKTATKLLRSAPSRPTAKRNRSSDRRRDAESRQRGCHHRRRKQRPRNRNRRRRRHAVRPRLPVSPTFVTNPDKMTTELEDCLILLHEKKLSSLQPMVPLLESVIQSGKAADDHCRRREGEALATLVVNKLRGGLKIAAVKAPGFGDRRKAMLQDIAILTGGQVISEDLGMKLENVDHGHAGHGQESLDHQRRDHSSSMALAKRPRSKHALPDPSPDRRNHLRLRP